MKTTNGKKTFFILLFIIFTTIVKADPEIHDSNKILLVDKIKSLYQENKWGEFFGHIIFFKLNHSLPRSNKHFCTH